MAMGRLLEGDNCARDARDQPGAILMMLVSVACENTQPRLQPVPELEVDRVSVGIDSVIVRDPIDWRRRLRFVDRDRSPLPDLSSAPFR